MKGPQDERAVHGKKMAVLQVQVKISLAGDEPYPSTDLDLHTLDAIRLPRDHWPVLSHVHIAVYHQYALGQHDEGKSALKLPSIKAPSSITSSLVVPSLDNASFDVHLLLRLLVDFLPALRRNAHPESNVVGRVEPQRGRPDKNAPAALRGILLAVAETPRRCERSDEPPFISLQPLEVKARNGRGAVGSGFGLISKGSNLCADHVKNKHPVQLRREEMRYEGGWIDLQQRAFRDFN